MQKRRNPIANALKLCFFALTLIMHAGTELIWFNIANIMAADALAPCVATRGGHPFSEVGW